MHKEGAGQPRLRDQFRNAIRVRHYSIRTEKTYWYWIRYFIRFHKLKHPLAMPEQDAGAFLSWLATERDIQPQRRIRPSMRLFFFTTIH
ncbi:site-specific integrase [Alcanivorax quisquiliarum]|uniref:Phage integrase N-terminal SAM-like domain-containing protein n=1 Tax=Alcanivorax quisquiliarum TaxID=2933565 RepID=A0ABT0E9H1_9GAMM|nr:site-specific integrase [Alcanivorax quisquiliarum]MCK0538480.1 phage integrase N-terminal SAM-like domain-containing protein [Alcanivorax quisquiliarum]